MINYNFANNKLLEEALTHSSCGKKRESGERFDNERLEFIGDAIFDAIIGEHLFHILPDAGEGALSKLRAAIVCESSLASAARAIGLDGIIRIGRSEEHTHRRGNDSIIADALEAVIGAIFLDGGYEGAKRFVLSVFEGAIFDAVSGKLPSDYKSELQEKVFVKGKNNNSKIKYIIESESGPDHDKTFNVILLISGKVVSRGSGKSKKEAEQNAAGNALKKGL